MRHHGHMDIHTVGNGREFLTEAQLQPLASVFAEAPAPAASKMYRQVKTIEVVNLFAGQGWYPVMAQEQRVIDAARNGFQKHMIRFRQKETAMARMSAPEIIVRNSHDTTTTYQIMGGMINFACLNGLIVSDAQFAMIRVMHMGFEPRAIIDATRKFAEGIPQIMDRVKDYQKIDLTPTDRQIFAESALLVKLNADEDVVPMRKENGVFKIDDREFDVPRFLAPARDSDRLPTLWNTFNTVQEKLISGTKFNNRFEVNTKPSFSNGRAIKKVRGVTAIDENVRINRGLWHLMSEMAKQKGATA